MGGRVITGRVATARDAFAALPRDVSVSFCLQVHLCGSICLASLGVRGSVGAVRCGIARQRAFDSPPFAGLLLSRV